jgi:hypothetical protein
MEFSPETMIDVGLSVAGYLAAGALWMVLYTLFSGRQRAETMAPAAAGLSSDPMTRIAIGDAVREKKSLQFVDLRGSKSSTSTTGAEMPVGPRADQYRRNRAEVIRMAREMLKDGRPREQVRDLLPISDGELALLASE